MAQIDTAIRSVNLKTSVTVDARFNFVLNSFPIQAHIAVVDQVVAHLDWEYPWLKSIDIHRLGGIRITHTLLLRILAGLLAPLFINNARLKAQHDKWLTAFKRAAESGHS
jgi:hypothetical protein